jgi:hypothetical protein
MISAHDTKANRALFLPLSREGSELEIVRTRAKDGELVCRDCRDLLWLKAGEERRPHFAHRASSDCPRRGTSEAVQAARWLLFLFFHKRVMSGKLAGPVDLEPTVSGLPKGTCVDLTIGRDDKPTVAVMFLEKGLKPETRDKVEARLRELGLLFRPVFLISQLTRIAEHPDGAFRLDTTQREWSYESPYGANKWRFEGENTLHVIDPAAETWTTLRRLRSLHHAPANYSAESERVSKVADILWCNHFADWTHPGEQRGRLIPRESALPPIWTVGELVCEECKRTTKQWNVAKRTGAKS